MNDGNLISSSKINDVFEIKITSPDNSYVTIDRNTNGSNTISNYDINQNKISSQLQRAEDTNTSDSIMDTKQMDSLDRVTNENIQITNSEGNQVKSVGSTKQQPDAPFEEITYRSGDNTAPQRFLAKSETDLVDIVKGTSKFTSTDSAVNTLELARSFEPIELSPGNLSAFSTVGKIMQFAPQALNALGVFGLGLDFVTTVSSAQNSYDSGNIVAAEHTLLKYVSRTLYGLEGTALATGLVASSEITVPVAIVLGVAGWSLGSKLGDHVFDQMWDLGAKMFGSMGSDTSAPPSNILDAYAIPPSLKQAISAAMYSGYQNSSESLKQGLTIQDYSNNVLTSVQYNQAQTPTVDNGLGLYSYSAGDLVSFGNSVLADAAGNILLGINQNVNGNTSVLSYLNNQAVLAQMFGEDANTQALVQTNSSGSHLQQISDENGKPTQYSLINSAGSLEQSISIDLQGNILGQGNFTFSLATNPLSNVLVGMDSGQLVYAAQLMDGSWITSAAGQANSYTLQNIVGTPSIDKITGQLKVSIPGATVAGDQLGYSIDPLTGIITPNHPSISALLVDATQMNILVGNQVALLNNNGTISVKPVNIIAHGALTLVEFKDRSGGVVLKDGQQAATFYENSLHDSDGHLTLYTIITRAPTTNPTIGLNQAWEYFYTGGKLSEVNAYEFTTNINAPWAVGAGRFYFWNSTKGILVDDRANHPFLAYSPDLSAQNQVFNITNQPEITLGPNGDVINYSASSGNLTIHPGNTSATINFSPEITPSLVSLTADQSGDLTILLPGSKAISMMGALAVQPDGSINSQISALNFSDGTSIKLSNPANQLPTYTFTAQSNSNLNLPSFGRNQVDLTSIQNSTVQGGSHGNIYTIGSGTSNISVNPSAGDVIKLNGSLSANQIGMSTNTSGDLILSVNGSPVIKALKAIGSGFQAGSVSSSITILASDSSIIPVNQASIVNQLNVSGGITVQGPAIGQDIFTFGQGAGTALGNNVNNSFTFHQGDGLAFVRLGTGTNQLSLGQNITAADLSLAMNNQGDLLINFANSADVISIVQDMLIGSNGQLTSTLNSISLWDNSQFNISPTAIIAREKVSGGATIVSPGYQTEFSFEDGGGTAQGGAGSNTYLFGSGSGNGNVILGSGSNRLKIGSGLTGANLTFSANSAGDFIVNIPGGNSITFKGDLSVVGGVTKSVLSPIQFADGTTLAIDNRLNYSYTVSDGATQQAAQFGPVTFNFTSNGGTAVGGANNNFYNFGAGSGTAIIYGGTGSNTVKLSSSINIANLLFASNTSGDLTISVANSQDSILLKSNLSISGSTVTSKIPYLNFANGQTLTLGSNLNYNQTVSVGNTVLANPFGRNTFQFAGSGGTAVGGQFANTYQINTGSGQVTVQTGSGSNTIQLGSGVSSGNLSYISDQQGNLTVSLGDGDSIYLPGELSIIGSTVTAKISYLYLSTGQTITLGSNLNYNLTVSAGNTVSANQFGKNTFQFAGSGGTALGGQFANIYQVNAGSGQVTIQSGSGSNTIQLGSGINVSNFAYTADQQGNLTISLGGGDSIYLPGELSISGSAVTAKIPYLSLFTGQSITLGSNLNYNLNVSAGNTINASPWGKTTFQFTGSGAALGGQFSNAYQIGAGIGAATIRSGSGSNTIQLGSGISATNLAYTSDQQGNLTVSLGGGDSIYLPGELSISGSTVTAKIPYLNLFGGQSITLGSNLSYNLNVSNGTSVNATVYGKNIFQFSNGGTAVGGQFANTYQIGAGSGAANIVTGSGLNSLSMLSGISASNLVWSATSAGDLKISVAGTNDSVTVAHDLSVQNGATTSVIPNLTLSNGSSISIGKSTTFTQTVTGGVNATGVMFGNNDFIFSGTSNGSAATGASGVTNTFEYQGSGIISISPVSLANLKFIGPATAQKLWFDRTGGDLLLTVLDGAQDQVKVQGYFNTPSLVQSIQSGDMFRLDTKISNLVTSMASYETAHPGFSPVGTTIMPTDTSLQSAISADWHR